MTGLLDSGSGGGTVSDSGGSGSSSNDDTPLGEGVAVNIPDTSDSGSLWESTETTASTDTIDSGGSTDSIEAGVTSVDEGLTRASPSGGGDAVIDDPVNPSAEAGTSDREAMMTEANQQQQTIEEAQADQSAPGASEGSANGRDLFARLDPKAVLAVVVILAVVGGGS